MRDCSNIGKHSLIDAAECRDAALELGNVYRFEGSWPHFPKGCISGEGIIPGFPFEYSWNYIGWNTHETGASKEQWYPICKTYYHPEGNYISNQKQLYSIKLIYYGHYKQNDPNIKKQYSCQVWLHKKR